MLAFSILSCPGTAIFFTHNLGKLINYWLHSVETTQLQLYRDWYTHFSAKGDCKVQCLLPMLFVGKTNIIPTHKLLTHTSVLTWGSAPHSNRTFTNTSKPFRDATWLKWWMSLGEGGREGGALPWGQYCLLCLSCLHLLLSPPTHVLQQDLHPMQLFNEQMTSHHTSQGSIK